MPLNRNRVREALKKFDFESLFIEELGWDRHRRQPLTVSVDAGEFELEVIAEKRGMVAFLYEPKIDGGRSPDYGLRRKIENQVRRTAHEHLIIYVDRDRQAQIWQWVRREPGRPAACREHGYQAGQSGDALVQKLEAISFSLDEEDALSIATVAGRARRAFDVERVTKRFYDRFQSEHGAFLRFIQGIQAQGDREWYGSLMLNRLMFVYFIQKKGFLDGDIDYLRNRLRLMQASKGKDKFHSFYRHFLLRLFHDGLGQDVRTSELDTLLGKVPYLNGGLFDVHDLERANASIEIGDEAFEKIFDFFDAYQWHLDARPLRSDNEINPDVLGYIFEKYINQKQMGAYYTKEDITEYICKNTVVPFLLDATRAECRIAFENPEGPTVWDLLKADPDRYINSLVRHGTDLSLPVEIAAGLNPPTLHEPVKSGPPQTLQLRTGWNRSAPLDYALPTETWREIVARRTRYEATHTRLASGELCEIGELVTLNLDLRQFAQDAIENCEGPELLRAFWQAMGKVTILDPTCGSGAFLFAALNILEPLYEACLDRMEAFLEDSDVDRNDDKPRPELFSDFRRILGLVAAHPNRRYFICKSIILNNLFGVDIMEEAVEICKLRLFLKLAAQVEPDSTHDNLGIEPLPDIDFNIKAGNTLVGFATYDDARRTITSKLDFNNAMEKISVKASDLQIAFDEFRKQQMDGVGTAATDHKPELRKQLAGLQHELNCYLGVEYGVDPEDQGRFASWLASHQPFHWFVEFYRIMNEGGFDVIVGNPPYVEYPQVSKTYTILSEAMRSLGNLHAMMTRRSLSILSSAGCMSMIVPVSLPSTDRFEGLRAELLDGRDAWVSHYDFRPAKLFEGAEQRLTIFILHPGTESNLHSTRYNRWYSSQRPYLFPCLTYTSSVGVRPLRSVWPKLDGQPSVSVLEKIVAQPSDIRSVVSGSSAARLYYKNTGILYHTTFTREAPECFINGRRAPSSRETALKMPTRNAQKALHCVLNSSVFFVVYEVHSNCRDLNPSDVHTFRLPNEVIGDSALQLLSDELHENQQSNSRFRIRNQRLTGEVRLQSFNPTLSKTLLDKVDHALALHYGFTEEELDFIINYDIKYRLGADEGHDEEPTE